MYRANNEIIDWVTRQIDNFEQSRGEQKVSRVMESSSSNPRHRVAVQARVDGLGELNVHVDVTCVAVADDLGLVAGGVGDV